MKEGLSESLSVLESERNGYDAAKSGPRDTGWVRYPRDLKDTGEGGMWVLAVFEGHEMSDRVFACAVDTLPVLLSANVFIGGMKSFSEEFGEERSFLAVVLLGTSSGAWWDEGKRVYWKATREDLSRKGKALVGALEELYGRKATLLTFLDT